MSKKELEKSRSYTSCGFSFSYVYDAVGTKLEKSAGGSVTLYAGNYIYQNGALQFFSHAEGYASPNGQGGYDYVYQYKDHLGNIRLSYTDGDGNGSIDPNAEIVEESNYYPFGLKHKGYNEVVSSFGNSVAQMWKFGGKEYEDDLGKNTVAYEWRDYDPAIGRFGKIDRFAEKYESINPYHFAANNPIYYVDIQGDSLWIQHKGNKILYDNGKLLNKDGTNYTGKGVKVQKDGSIKLSGFLEKAVGALNQISKGKEGNDMLTELQSSDNNFTIVEAAGSKFDATDNYKAYANQWATDPMQAKTYSMLQKGGKNFKDGSGGIINWNSSGSPLITLGGTSTNGNMDLAHEMFHALDANRGLLDDRLDSGLKRSEWQATYRENILRGQLGLPLRSHYKASLNAATGVRSGLPPRMLTPAPANSPILPVWYKK
ncbi:M91 family zinc metallopeptidase [Flagellimonas beolgyonensis]|uniref:M91 family zinc metallopeptidase n=1 Tax=Flagellimonas beolgyonensis TaxID=864064 RepID=UPI003D6507C8